MKAIFEISGILLYVCVSMVTACATDDLHAPCERAQSSAAPMRADRPRDVDAPARRREENVHRSRHDPFASPSGLAITTTYPSGSRSHIFNWKLEPKSQP
jgi:hypothetical protein